MNAITNTNSLTMSSRDIADLTGKEHKNVVRTIKDLLSVGILDAQIEPLKFEYRGQWFDYYELNKRDSLVLVARLSPEFTAHVVDRWQELEAKQVQPVMLPSDYKSALQALLATVEDNERLTFERDIAVKTKAQISDRKTATALVTASHAVQANSRLRDKLGQSKNNATIRAVENATKSKYDWRPLKSWCRAHDTKPLAVIDDLYGTVKTYPAQAWLDVYKVDLSVLFGGVV